MAKAPTASPAKAAHSVRVSDVTWERARVRCVSEGTTMNAMLNELMDGYGRGLINLPKITKSYAATNAAGLKPMHDNPQA